MPRRHRIVIIIRIRHHGNLTLSMLDEKVMAMVGDTLRRWRAPRGARRS